MEGGTTVTIREEIFFNENIYLTFFENWYYDASVNELTKDVTAIGLGKYNEMKDVGMMLVIIPLTNSGKFHADLALTDISYDARTGGDTESDAYFHILTNKLGVKAHSDHSLLRTANYPFSEKIPESLFKATCDTISKCYDFGFSEDWVYDSVNFSLHKTVKNIQFRYKKGSYSDFPLQTKATFIFKSFKENIQIKNSHSLDCIQTGQPFYRHVNDALSSEDSLVKNGVTKLVKSFYSKIIEYELRAFMPAECIDMGKVLLSMDEFKHRLTTETSGVEYDSVGNIVSEKVFIDTMNYFDGLRMNESIQFDLAANKVRRDVKMLTPVFYIDYKEIFKSLFSVSVKSDSNYVPVPADLICKNAKQKVVFQQNKLLFDGYTEEMNTEGFSPGDNLISYKGRYELLSSIYNLAQNGTIKLYKPGTDSVLSIKEVAAIKDSLTIKSLGNTETPNWFLSVSEMQTLEDWYYNEKTNVFKIVTKEIIFCRKRSSGFTDKVFSLKYAQ
ncbi:MAG: hypothetical protein IAF38_17960 [Bacteroidia bacterium]|nr:hypothetical protein [Bacteroidia bacterium]